MPHFAEINPETSEVLRVKIAESKIWCEYHLSGTWVETHKNTPGYKYAGRGYIYNKDKDNFHIPQPYPSWTLDDTCNWRPPISKPIDGKKYTWNEETQNWDEIPE